MGQGVLVLRGRQWRRPSGLGAVLRGAQLALWALVFGCRSPEPPPSDPAAAPPQTVILVVGCTLRADRTTVHGHSRPTTPYLGALARQGAHFDRTIANSGWTRPTVAAITTGVHPVRMGLDDDPHRAIAPEFQTLAERFQAEGWATVGITANPNANAVFGFAQGFDAYVGTDGLFRDGPQARSGVEVVDDFIDRVAEVDGPLFGQLVLLDAHSPWDRGLLAQVRQGHWPTLRREDRYDAALRSLDTALARLDQELDRIGRGDRLLVVIGDHGQGLGLPQWAGTGHGTVLYDAHVHVPWVLHGPRVAPGQRVSGLSQQLDLVPTLTAMAALPADPGLPGRDRSAAVAGLPEGEAVPAAILSASRVREADELRLTTDAWTIFTVRGEHPRPRQVLTELFRTEDRQQEVDLTSEELRWSVDLRVALYQAWRAEHDARVIVPVDVDADQAALLQALGYLDTPTEE